MHGLWMCYYCYESVHTSLAICLSNIERIKYEKVKGGGGFVVNISIFGLVGNLSFMI